MKEQKDIWFPAKKHGIGWGLPVKWQWQGWMVLILYALFLIIGAVFLTKPSMPVGFFIGYIVILSLFLVLICWKKGERK